MKTKTVRVSIETVDAAEIQAIKESAEELKRINAKDIIEKAVNEYVTRKSGKSGKK